MPHPRTETDPRPEPVRQAPDELRQEIDQTLREVAAMAAEERSPAGFYDELLARVTRVTGARGAAVWIVGAGGAVHLLRQHHLVAALGGRWRAAIDRERRRIEAWLDGEPEDDQENDRLALAGRISPAGKPWGLVTVYLGADAAPARAGLQKFVDAVAASATDYQSRSELRHWNQDRDALSRLHDLTMALHRPWSRREVLSEVAHEGRRFLDCDRVAVATRRGAHYRLAAASGATTVSRRSAELQSLEKLIARAMRLGQPLFYEEPSADQPREPGPPQIEEPLNAYLDESATRRLAIVPLDSAGEPGRRPPAALVVEQMSDRPLDASSQAVWLLAEHAAVAVDRATRVARVPIIGPMLGVESLRRTITRRWAPRGLLVLAALAAVVAALVLVPADYSVRVEGELVPATRQNVFAPTDGVVAEIYVEHGDRVEAGQLLAELRSPELEIERTRVRGSIAAAEQQLAAARTARLEALSMPDGARSQGQLAGDEKLIEQQLAALAEELRLIDQQCDRLRVVSPIAGSIVSWDVRQALGARPVARGQRLLAVAKLDGPWLARFHAPDRRAGPILETQTTSPDGVRVRFVTASRPDEPQRVVATRSRLANEPDPATGENQVLLEAPIAPAAATGLRPGAEIVGRVECGSRSLGYVWLGELYEELRRWFF